MIERDSYVPLASFSGLWIASSVSQVVVLKYFQLLLNPRLPWFLALVGGLGFVFTFPVYLLCAYQRSRETRAKNVSILQEPVYNGRMGYHILAGLLVALQLVAISFALEFIPGSTFTVLRTSELVIALVMSKIFLGKTYSRAHHICVAAIITGSVIVALTMPGKDEVHEYYNIPLGTLITVCGAASSSSGQSVLTEYMQSKGIINKKLQYHSMEAGAYSVLFAFFWLCVPLIISPEKEWVHWKQALQPHMNGKNILLLSVLCLSRATAVTSKIASTLHSDAMFNRSLSSVRRALQILCMSILFKEVIPFISFLGISVTLIAAYFYTLIDKGYDANKPIKCKERINHLTEKLISS